MKPDGCDCVNAGICLRSMGGSREVGEEVEDRTDDSSQESTWMFKKTCDTALRLGLYPLETNERAKIDTAV